MTSDTITINTKFNILFTDIPFEWVDEKGVMLASSQVNLIYRNLFCKLSHSHYKLTKRANGRYCYMNKDGKLFTSHEFHCEFALSNDMRLEEIYIVYNHGLISQCIPKVYPR